jgi:hypothetical protein
MIDKDLKEESAILKSFPTATVYTAFGTMKRLFEKCLALKHLIA